MLAGREKSFRGGSFSICVLIPSRVLSSCAQASVFQRSETSHGSSPPAFVFLQRSPVHRSSSSRAAESREQGWKLLDLRARKCKKHNVTLISLACTINFPLDAPSLFRDSSRKLRRRIQCHSITYFIFQRRHLPLKPESRNLQQNPYGSISSTYKMIKNPCPLPSSCWPDAPRMSQVHAVSRQICDST